MTTVGTVMTDYNALGTAALKAQVHDQIHTAEHLPPPLPAGPHFDDALPNVLVGCSVMGTADERDQAQGFWSIFKGTPNHVAAIEATSTALAKGWATALGSTGALTAIGVWLKGWPAGVWSTASDSLKVALSLSVALVVTALLLAIAAIVTADLQARSRAGAAQFDARARIAAAYIATVTRRDTGLVHEALDAIYTLAADTSKKVSVSQTGTPPFTSDSWRDGPDGYPEAHNVTTGEWLTFDDTATISLR